jgi:hypothetical protein
MMRGSELEPDYDSDVDEVAAINQSNIVSDSNSQSAHSGAENALAEAMDIDSDGDYGDDSLPARKQLFEIVVPTLKELTRDRVEYHSFRVEFVDDEFPENARVMRVVEEVERDGCLWYRTRFSNAKIMVVSYLLGCIFQMGVAEMTSCTKLLTTAGSNNRFPLSD